MITDEDEQQPSTSANTSKKPISSIDWDLVDQMIIGMKGSEKISLKEKQEMLKREENALLSYQTSLRNIQRSLQLEKLRLLSFAKKKISEKRAKEDGIKGT